MEERGLFWPDVQAVIDDPQDVRSGGMDKYVRLRWIVRGTAATGEEIEIVCAIELDHRGIEFLTIYWKE